MLKGSMIGAVVLARRVGNGVYDNIDRNYHGAVVECER